ALERWPFSAFGQVSVGQISDCWISNPSHCQRVPPPRPYAWAIKIVRSQQTESEFHCGSCPIADRVSLIGEARGTTFLLRGIPHDDRSAGARGICRTCAASRFEQGPEETIQQAARTMAGLDAGVLPVGEKDHLV